MVAKCAIVGSHGMNEFLPGSVEVLVLQRRVPAPGHVIMTPVDTFPRYASSTCLSRSTSGKYHPRDL